MGLCVEAVLEHGAISSLRGSGASRPGSCRETLARLGADSDGPQTPYARRAARFGVPLRRLGLSRRALRHVGLSRPAPACGQSCLVCGSPNVTHTR